MTDIRARVAWKVPGRPNQLIAFRLDRNYGGWFFWSECSTKAGEYSKLPIIDLPEISKRTGERLSQVGLTRHHITSLLSQSALSPEQISFLTAALLRGDIR